MKHGRTDPMILIDIKLLKEKKGKVGVLQRFAMIERAMAMTMGDQLYLQLDGGGKIFASKGKGKRNNEKVLSVKSPHGCSQSLAAHLPSH